MSVQSTRHIMLIEPAEFYANPETMDTNVYQIDEHEDHEVIYQRALHEFRHFRDMLVESGVYITLAKGHVGSPDMLFPNWVSTHEDGMVLYPMVNENRRAERDPAIIEFMGKTYDLRLDMRHEETSGKFLEATGSLCLDRVNKVAYAALSKRTDKALAQKWCDEMGYKDLVTFDTQSHAGLPVYHTDLVMFIGTEVAGLCTECIDKKSRDAVRAQLARTHDIVDLTMEQQQQFCGNSLEVIGAGGEKMLVMSASAWHALTDPQKEHFGRYYAKIMHSDIHTIEIYGGGSARCLMLEMF